MVVVAAIVLRIVLLCLIAGLLGTMDITASCWQFWVILFSTIGIYLCGCFIGMYTPVNKMTKDPSEYTCAACEHLNYNSDGSTECQMEFEHKCRPETKVMYKNIFKNAMKSEDVTSTEV